ncbi:hypothetical protein [Dictyobacter arantiisoli]|uniref:GH18 domain-containing protein n=1 Tax=Dictyobacter arantiisoli TaxID=2014874 RepID=A0A5A5TGK7_9CHLR|nr:hypothetical protein [Dictyobacter arantiisoli]GCF10084.1 hypothetical protein KDI_36480 [Dictyobacter arantiisoli]
MQKYNETLSPSKKLLLMGLMTLFLTWFCLCLLLLLRPQKLPLPPRHVKTHLVGGFSMTTPARAIQASTEGVQVVFQYGNPPSEHDPLGQKLQALHMKVVDGYIASNLYYYECQRSRAMVPPPVGLDAYCGQRVYPTFTDEDAFLSTIRAHIQQSMTNPLIIGYWVLDDWAPWDEGSARGLLAKIHHFIQLYTPGHPAICGFGGTLYTDMSPGWDDEVANNFSPQGCDNVALYIYTTSMPAVSHPPSPAAYDWSMSQVLPVMLTSLHLRGWDIKKEPLIGIAQAFGGPIAHKNAYRVPPTANDIALQSKAFCENGASGLVFYGWSDSEIGPASLSPMTSLEIENGIRAGIAACKHYWNDH